MSRSRVSRIDLPLSMLSTTARRRECFWTSRARAYRCRARACPESPFHAGSARRAAVTAASTSPLVPCDTRASAAAVDGSMTSIASPGDVHAPPMKWPNRPSCDASHLRASASDSGAGPYSIVSKISLTEVMFLPQRAQRYAEELQRRKLLQRASLVQSFAFFGVRCVEAHVGSHGHGIGMRYAAA